MKRIRTCLAMLAAASMLAACAADYVPRPAWELQDADFRRLKSGMKAEQVETLVGKPALKTVFPRLDEEVWDYSYFDVQTPMKALLHFDGKGVLKYHTQSFDNAYYHGGAER